MRRLSGWLIVLGLFTSTSAWGQQALPARELARLKAATVYVKVKHGSLEASGSGFVVKRIGADHYVVTNHHVVVMRGSVQDGLVLDRAVAAGEQGGKAHRGHGQSIVRPVSPSSQRTRLWCHGLVHSIAPGRFALQTGLSRLRLLMANKLTKYSSRVTQPKAQGASQAMLYATGLSEADMQKAVRELAGVGQGGTPCAHPPPVWSSPRTT